VVETGRYREEACQQHAALVAQMQHGRLQLDQDVEIHLHSDNWLGVEG